jgi:hypothetical protein
MLLEEWLEAEKKRHSLLRVYESSGLKLWECFDGCLDDMRTVSMDVCCSFSPWCR